MPLGRGSADPGEAPTNVSRNWKGQWSEMRGFSPDSAGLPACDFVRPSISNFLHPQVWNHISLHFQSSSQGPSRSMTCPRFNSGGRFLLYPSPAELIQEPSVAMTGTGDIQWQEESRPNVPWNELAPTMPEDTIFFKKATF